jgi:anti-sigma factor RsiW
VLRTDDYQAELAEEIVDAHVLSLQSDHLTGISSNDERAVNGWFKGRLKFALPARDFANEGFSLQGGRLDVVDERSVAVLVHASTGHLINVFVWPTQRRATSPQVGSGKAINGLVGEKAE